jgi:nucleoid-associated protein YgaU
MLSDIALQVYGDAHKFRLIQAANPSLRYKPNRILVDQVIIIPPDKP